MNDHPVWDLYNQYRTARLNVKYYTKRADNLGTWNVVFEVFVALFVSSSAIAGFGFWNSEYGKNVWSVLAGIATILAVIKPIIRLPDKIAKATELMVSYKTSEEEFKKITFLINQERRYTPEIKKMFLQANDNLANIAIVNDGLRNNKKLIKECEAEVNNELPTNNFFIPQGE